MGTTTLAGVNHLAVVTEDLDRLIGFYRDVFDAAVDWVLVEDGLRHAMIDLGGGAALHPFEMPANPHARGLMTTFARGHLDHVALNVADEETFESLRRRLVEAGASDGTVVDWGAVRSVSFEDPDGADCELALWCSDGVPLRFDERVVHPYVAD